MNRNQKIAIGCGGAGCLGLIVVAVASVAFYFFWYERQPRMTNRNSNVNINSNTNRSLNSNTSTDSPDETPPSSRSDDDKHKLFQAASAANDIEVFNAVMRKLGLFTASDSPTGAYGDFVKEHATWTLANLEFVASVATPDKARAYVEEHLDD